MKKRLTGIILALAVLAAITPVVTWAVQGEAVFTLGTGVGVIASEVEMVKSATVGERLRFCEEDFKSALLITDFSAIEITSLPNSEEGMLLAAGHEVRVGQRIKRKNIGSLVFVPLTDKVSESSFEFRVIGAGAELVTRCRIRYVKSANAAPKVPTDTEASLGLYTQSGIPLYGRLGGSDEDGDEIEFIAVGYPSAGAIEIKNASTGGFVYTPRQGFVGYDEFSYVIRDEYGNYSDVCHVRVKVNERVCDLVLCDMTERSEYGAAVAMCALGVMSGEAHGDVVYFKPDERVTRAEFVAMALKAYGINPEGSGESFFDDKEEVPSAYREYVGYAARAGIIDGDFTEAGLIFRPSDTVTRLDAAVILSRLLGVSVGEEAEYPTYVSVASWAAPSVQAMITLGIFDFSEGDGLADTLTRAEVAECLYRMINVK